MLDLGMEGSVIKRRDSATSPVSARRSWRKLKAIASEDCEIVGFEDGKNGRSGEVGAIVVRLPSGVETTASGMTDKVRADMLAEPGQVPGQDRRDRAQRRAGQRQAAPPALQAHARRPFARASTGAPAMRRRSRGAGRCPRSSNER
jgi:ATP-dependent DNA ligase